MITETPQIGELQSYREQLRDFIASDRVMVPELNYDNVILAAGIEGANTIAERAAEAIARAHGLFAVIYQGPEESARADRTSTLKKQSEIIISLGIHRVHWDEFLDDTKRHEETIRESLEILLDRKGFVEHDHCSQALVWESSIPVPDSNFILWEISFTIQYTLPSYEPENT